MAYKIKTDKPKENSVGMTFATEKELNDYMQGKNNIYGIEKPKDNSDIPQEDKPVFYYKVAKSTVSRTYGGANETLEVFEVKNNKIEKIGETSYCTRSYKGKEGEVMDVLLDTGKITKEEFNKSQNNHSSGGYFTYKNWFNIREI